MKIDNNEKERKERERRLYEKLIKMGYVPISIEEKEKNQVPLKELVKRLFLVLVDKFKKICLITLSYLRKINNIR